MTAQFAESGEDHELARARQDRLMFQMPGVLVGNVDGVQTDLHRGIDVAARTVADHPAMRLYDLVLVDEAAVGLRVFLRHDFDEFEESLEPGALYFRGLFGRLALRKKNQAVPFG